MRLWLGLLGGGDHREDLVSAAVASGVPIDVSSAPAMWGSCLRGSKAQIATFGGGEARRATSAGHAARLVEAHLVETLSAVGGMSVDTYFLCTDGLSEDQREGAIEALSLAKDDGTVRQIGVYTEGAKTVVPKCASLICRPANPLAATQRGSEGCVACRTLNWCGGVPFCAMPSPWRSRDLARSFNGASIAQGVLARRLAEGPVLVGVRTVGEVEEAIAAQKLRAPEGLDAVLAEFAAAYRDEANWKELCDDRRGWVREAARRWLDRAS